MQQSGPELRHAASSWDQTHTRHIAMWETEQGITHLALVDFENSIKGPRASDKLWKTMRIWKVGEALPGEVGQNGEESDSQKNRRTFSLFHKYSPNAYWAPALWQDCSRPWEQIGTNATFKLLSWSLLVKGTRLRYIRKSQDTKREGWVLFPEAPPPLN